MRWAATARRLLAGAVLAMGAAAAAADTIYKWVDATGDFHVTDRLDDVPEPYRSMYIAQRKVREQQEKKDKSAGRKPTAAPAPAPARGERPTSTDAAKDNPNTPPPSKGGGVLAREEAREAQWRAAMLQARQELDAAMTHLAGIDDALAQAELNPVLKYTPQGYEEVARLGQERAQAVARVAAARTLLADELPAKARREAVPPRWLEP